MDITDIRRRRHQLELSLQQLADLVVMDMGHLSRLERGLVPRPSHRLLTAIDATLRTQERRIARTSGRNSR